MLPKHFNRFEIGVLARFGKVVVFWACSQKSGEVLKLLPSLSAISGVTACFPLMMTDNVFLVVFRLIDTFSTVKALPVSSRKPSIVPRINSPGCAIPAILLIICKQRYFLFISERSLICKNYIEKAPAFGSRHSHSHYCSP